MPNQLQANDLRQRLNDLDQRAISEILSAASNAELNQLRVKYLSKKGEVTSILRSMSSIESELRPEIGSLANALRTKIERALEQRQADILEEQLRSEREAFDPTVPPRRSLAGSLHPVTIVRRELEEIFRGMGFTVVDGPELETDYYNFELNTRGRIQPATCKTLTG